MIEIPSRCHLELWRPNLVKWEWEIRELLHELALCRPERPDDLVVVSINDLIDCRVDVQQVVG